MAVLTCKQCGNTLAPGDVFCTNCGAMADYTDEEATSTGSSVSSFPPTTVSPQCKSCGADVEESDQFCPECGALLKDASPQSSADLGVASDSTAEQGIAVDGFCPECGGKTRAGWVYCMSCGQKLRIPSMGNSSYVVADSRPKAVPVPEPMQASAPEPSSVQVPALEPVTTLEPHPNATPVINARTVPIDNLNIPHSVANLDVDMGWNASGVEIEPDDAPTTLYDEDEDIDSPTMIYESEDEQVVCKLLRRRTGEVYQLDLPASLGKGSAASVRISGSRIISRVHARLYTRDGDLFIEDSASTNGTFVNGQRLVQGEPIALHHGDVIRLADEEFELIVED